MTEPTTAAPVTRHRGVVLLGILVTVVLAGVDGTVVGTAMPVAVAELGGASLYAWAFAAYMLAIATTMPVWGPGSDRWGRRRTYLVGVVVFLVGSIGGAAAPSMPWFIAARVVQGIGAGAIFSLPFIVLAVVYPPHRRARALGVVASAWALSSVAGPVIGTAIVSTTSWRWVFLVNLPIGAVAMTLIGFALTESFGERRGRFDVLGALLAATGAALLIDAFVRLGRGEATLWQGAEITAAVAAFVAFVAQERRAESPVLPLGFFRSRMFAAGMVASFLSSFAAFAIAAFLPLYVSQQFGSAGAVGLVIGFFTVGWSLAALAAGRVVHRHGERVFVIAGMIVLGVGAFAIAAAFANGLPWVIAAAFVAGVGMGLMTPALTVSVQNSVPVERLGAATGSQQFLRQLGASIGVGSFGFVFQAVSFNAALMVLIAVTVGGMAAGRVLPATSLPPPPAAAA